MEAQGREAYRTSTTSKHAYSRGGWTMTMKMSAPAIRLPHATEQMRGRNGAWRRAECTAYSSLSIWMKVGNVPCSICLMYQAYALTIISRLLSIGPAARTIQVSVVSSPPNFPGWNMNGDRNSQRKSWRAWRS